jgi:hypothetical protein
VRRNENGAIGMHSERKGKDESADCCCAAVLGDGDALAATKSDGVASAATNDEVTLVATTDRVALVAMESDWVDKLHLWDGER